MDELKRQLDEEARQVQSDPEALEAVRRQAGRRRVTRQIGTGTLALAVAAGGFALAWDAFRGPLGKPVAGPTSPSPSPQVQVRLVWNADVLEEYVLLSDQLVFAGYDLADDQLAETGEVHTTMQYAVRARKEAEIILQKFLPGVEAEAVGWLDTEPEIQIILGSDYPKLFKAATRVRVLDGSGLAGAATAAVTILEGEGYHVVEVRKAGSSYDRTFISCASVHDAQGASIQRDLFPQAEIRGALPNERHDVTVHIGRDFYDDYAGLSP